MKKVKNHYEMEPGDTVVLRQKNGQELHVLASETGVMVNAPSVGTKIETEKTSHFSHFLKVVEA